MRDVPLVAVALKRLNAGMVLFSVIWSKSPDRWTLAFVQSVNSARATIITSVPKITQPEF
jgi:hypothetical protein